MLDQSVLPSNSDNQGFLTSANHGNNLKAHTVYLNCSTLTFGPLFSSVPSEPPQNVRAISVTSDEAVITWAEPPRLTLHGVLKGYRVVFWSLFPDGGGCCGGQAQWPMQSNYHLSHSKLHQPRLPPNLPLCQCCESECVDVCLHLSHRTLPVPVRPWICSCLPDFLFVWDSWWDDCKVFDCVCVPMSVQACLLHLH